MAPVFELHMEGDGAWPDLADKEVIHLGSDAPAIQISALSEGMVGGMPSLAFRFDLPDGQVVVFETSLQVFLTAARALWARYDEELGPEWRALFGGPP